MKGPDESATKYCKPASPSSRRGGYYVSPLILKQMEYKIKNQKTAQARDLKAALSCECPMQKY